jgi:hypothetical protein
MWLAATRGTCRGTSYAGRVVERGDQAELAINGVVLEPDECEIYGLVIEEAADDEISRLRDSGYCLQIHRARDRGGKDGVVGDVD